MKAFVFPAQRRILRPSAGAVLALATVAGLLGGCASQRQFPSLAKRPAELVAEGRIARSALPAAPLPAPARGLELELPENPAARAGALAETARTAHARFEEQRGPTAALVTAAKGSARGAEPWAVAGIALAELSAARSDTAVPLAELDEIDVAHRVGAANSIGAKRVDGGDGQAIAAARDQVTAWVADEDAVLADLSGRLGD